ncbi:unnamed protein product, partial [Effrenium voratum]
FCPGAAASAPSSGWAERTATWSHARGFGATGWWCGAQQGHAEARAMTCVKVTLAWYACAVFTAAAIKQSSHRNMLSVFANLVIGWPLVAPFAAIGGCHRLALHWRKVLLIAILAGLEKNLTNSSLSHIGGALKTALHGLNVVFTFFVAAFAGADDRSKFCILGCQCRGNLLLALSVVLVA